MSANRHTQAPVEAITFDVGGTLIECWPSVGPCTPRSLHVTVIPNRLPRC